MPYLLTDGFTGQPGFVEADGLIRVHPRVVSALMFGGGQVRQVFWSVVGLDAVEVVDVLFSRGDGDRPVLVGLDVRPRSNFPTQSDVPVGGRIALRFAVGERLPGKECADFDALVKQATAGRTPTALASRIWNRDTAADAGDSRHTTIVAQWPCHEHFGSDTAFTRHRTGVFGVDRRCLTVEEMMAPYGKSQKPRLVRTDRKYGAVWVTALKTQGETVPAIVEVLP